MTLVLKAIEFPNVIQHNPYIKKLVAFKKDYPELKILLFISECKYAVR